MAELEIINTGKWEIREIDALLRRTASIDDPGEKIALISGFFLGTQYLESTLAGDEEKAEVFVINFEGLDCFTFLDYVEGMRLAGSFEEFKQRLKTIRYRSGLVSYKTRNHFFSDWLQYNSASIYDCTKEIGLSETKVIRKVLNQKKDGTLFLPGIAPVERKFDYIASSSINEDLLSRLRNGDYIGIYSELDGLDVSHVGIFIRKDDQYVIRHASSRKEVRKVVDQDFPDYLKNKPGIIVLRAK